MPDYGQLSRRTLDDMIAGARVEVAPYKRDPTDFVLWKPSAENEPGWDSPWGRGRPGWHIECSAMSWKHLGERFDIHGGGIDLVFPHHENEIAQSRCAFGHPAMANVWMHNGFLQVEGEKMSKSIGNFVTIRELLATDRFGGQSWDGAVLRLAMLRTHYRQPIDWTVEGLTESERLVERWRNTVRRKGFDPQPVPAAMIEALSDDLNTPAALRVLSELGTRANGYLFGGGDVPPLPEAAREAEGRRVAGELVAAADLLGIALDVAQEQIDETDRVAIQTLIDARLAARAARNWAESDRIRDELTGMGVVLMDNKDGTTSWELKP
jgi:cysteinyl-tRNA synthetase